MRILHIVICDLPRSAMFCTLSDKLQDFRKKIIEKHVCFGFLIKFLFLIFLNLGKSEWHILTNALRSSCEYLIFLSDFNGRTDRQIWRSSSSLSGIL